MKKVCDFGLYSIVFQIMSQEKSYFKLEITIFIRELSSYYCFNQKRIKIEFLDFCSSIVKCKSKSENKVK